MKINASKHFDVWALPLAITNWRDDGIFMIHFLCFTVRFIGGRWKKS